MEWVMIKPPTWDHFDVLQGGSTAEASATRTHVVDLHHNNTAPMSWPGCILEGDNSSFNNLQPRGGSGSNNTSNCNNNSSGNSNNNVVATQLGVSRSRISSQLCMQGSTNGTGFMATASSGHPSNGHSFNYSTAGTSSQLPSSTSSSDQEEGRSHAGLRGRANGSWQLFMGDIKGEAADDHGRYNDRSDHHAGDHAVMQEMAAPTRAGGRYNVGNGSGFPRVASGLHLPEKPKSELIHAVKAAHDTETTDVSAGMNGNVLHDHSTKKDLNNGNNQDNNNNSNASLANTGPHEHHPKRPLEMNDAAASTYGRAGKKPHHRTSSSPHKNNNNNGSNNNGHTNNPIQHQNVPRCQVEGCREDLSKAKKDYHRRHKVCEAHSKAPRVIASGMEQRFCQQCSRFHVLSEFDDAKRSCRKRLAGHNERRRKSSQDASALSAASIFQDDRMRRLSYLMQHPALSVALPLQQYDHAGSTLASRARNGAWSSPLDDINLAMVCRAQAALMSSNASAGSADTAQRLLTILQAQNHNNNHHHHHHNNSSSSNVKLASAYENDYGSNSCHEIVPFKSNGNNVDHHHYQSSGGNNGILGEGLSLSSSTASISAGSSNCSSQGPTSSNTNNNTDNHNNNTMLFAASLEAAAAAGSTRSTHHNQQQSALLDSGRALSLLSSGQVLQPNTSGATNFSNKHPNVLITSSPSPTHQQLNPALNSLSIAQHHHHHSTHHHYNNVVSANATTTDSPLTAAAADHADNHQLLSCTSQQLALSIGMCGTSVLDEKETMMSSNYNNIKPLMQALSGANPGMLARLMQQQQQQQGPFSSDNSHSISTVNHSGQHTTGLDSVDLLLSTSHHENLHSLRAAAPFEPSLFTAHANY